MPHGIGRRISRKVLPFRSGISKTMNRSHATADAIVAKLNCKDKVHPDRHSQPSVEGHMAETPGFEPGVPP